MTTEAIAAQIPGAIMSDAFAELLTRARTLDSAMGPDGLVRSAQNLLDDDHTRQLIQQLPMDEIWRVHSTVLQIAQARQLLAIAEARRVAPLPPPPANTPQLP
jgi:hypothetical protein